MNKDQVQIATSSSTPILGLLGIVFIYLKLTHVLAWSWLWVLAPFWAPPVLFLAILAVIVLFLVAGGLIAACAK